MQRRDGKSLTEYALIFGLVIVVAIPAISYMGSTIQNSYLENQPSNKAEELFSLLDVNQDTSDSSSLAGSGNLTGDYSFYEGGIDLSTLGTNTTSAKGNLSELINDGSSSTTQALSDLLKQMGDNLDLDPAMNAHLQALAEIGYQNALAAQAVEESFLNGDPMGTVNNLSGQLGFSGYSTIIADGSLDFATDDAAGKTDWISEGGPIGKTKELLDYYQANVLGQIEDPEIALIIHNSVDQIAHASGSIQDLGTRINGGNHPLAGDFSATTSDRQQVLDAFMALESQAFGTVAETAYNSSDTIEQASNKICTTGDGTASSPECR